MNLIPTKRIELRVNLVLVEYLDELLRTGLYGENRQAVIERLVCEGIENKLKDSFIRRFHWDGGEIASG